MRRSVKFKHIGTYMITTGQHWSAGSHAAGVAWLNEAADTYQEMYLKQHNQYSGWAKVMFHSNLITLYILYHLTSKTPIIIYEQITFSTLHISYTNSLQCNKQPIWGEVQWAIFFFIMQCRSEEVWSSMAKCTLYFLSLQLSLCLCTSV